MKLDLYVAIGGQSTEHEVSIKSGFNILTSANKDKYNINVLYITQMGDFAAFPMPNDISLESFFDLLKTTKAENKTHVLKEHFSCNKNKVVFPIIHGQFGEDGRIQGLFDYLCVPYVGSSVSASAVGMDKALMKLVAKSLDIPMADFVCLNSADEIFECREKLEFPLFVKPSNGGSSVGASSAKNMKELECALNLAFKYDNKVLVEELIVGREIEVCILGNKNLLLGAGEFIRDPSFFDYHAKYLDKSLKMQIPAIVDNDDLKKIEEYAVKIFNAIGAKGLSRVDFFYTDEGLIFFNEINTLPGFTLMSMYPSLFNKLHDINPTKLIDKLIDLAFEKL